MNLDARLTRADAARKIKVLPQTIGMWKTRGHISPGDDGLYRLGDVLEVERRMRHHPNSRRRLCPAR